MIIKGRGRWSETFDERLEADKFSVEKTKLNLVSKK